jgi:hypothetical protein
MDWQPTAPAEGNFTETITDASATGLAFGNQLIPAAPETPAVSTNATIV